LYGAEEELALEHDRIEALAIADRSQAARQAWLRRHPPRRTPAQPEQNDVVFAALEAACAYCGKPMAVADAARYRAAAAGIARSAPMAGGYALLSPLPAMPHDASPCASWGQVAVTSKWVVYEKATS
jgi:hypothetical protein